MRWFSEAWNAPHIGRGTFLGIIFWSLGAWVFSLHGAATTSIIAVFVCSILWEICDQQRFTNGKFLWWKTASDKFDAWDVVADMVGCLMWNIGVWWAQLLEIKLQNHPGIF